MILLLHTTSGCVRAPGCPVGRWRPPLVPRDFSPHRDQKTSLGAVVVGLSARGRHPVVGRPRACRFRPVKPGPAARGPERRRPPATPPRACAGALGLAEGENRPREGVPGANSAPPLYPLNPGPLFVVHSVYPARGPPRGPGFIT